MERTAVFDRGLKESVIPSAAKNLTANTNRNNRSFVASRLRMTDEKYFLTACYLVGFM